MFIFFGMMAEFLSFFPGFLSKVCQPSWFPRPTLCEGAEKVGVVKHSGGKSGGGGERGLHDCLTHRPFHLQINQSFELNTVFHGELPD